MNDIPALFGYGRDGVPGEYRDFLHHRELELMREEGLYKGGAVKIAFAAHAVDEAAKNLSELWKTEKARVVAAKDYYPELDPVKKQELFMLHAYCASCGKPAPASLLRATFELSNLTEGEPDRDFARRFGIIHFPVKKRAKFFEASRLDGEADTWGEKLSASELAETVGCDRNAIGRWRQMAFYKERRETACHAYLTAMSRRLDELSRKLLDEMSRKLDEMSRKLDEMSRRFDAFFGPTRT